MWRLRVIGKGMRFLFGMMKMWTTVMDANICEYTKRHTKKH
jgi:hypothetical protein